MMSNHEAVSRVAHVMRKYRKCKDVSPRIQRKMHFLLNQFENREVYTACATYTISEAISQIVKEIENTFDLI